MSNRQTTIKTTALKKKVTTPKNKDDLTQKMYEDNVKSEYELKNEDDLKKSQKMTKHKNKDDLTHKKRWPHTKIKMTAQKKMYEDNLKSKMKMT